MTNLHNLTIGHCNIQGGLIGISKSTQISDMIKKYDMDILSLNETNLNDTIATDSLNIPANYTFLRNDRKTGSRGGCGLLISNKVAYDDKLKVNVTPLSNIEAKWIKIKSSNFYICGFYRSRGYSKLDNFLDYFTECMNKLKGKKVIWIGDINVDQNKINDLDYRKLDSTLKSFNMVQTIQKYTRVAKKGNKFTYSTIDVIITNCCSDFENSSVLPEQLGDHFSIKCELQFKVEKPPKFEKISIHDYSSNNIKAFKTYLDNINFMPLFMSDQVDNALSILETHLNKYHDHFFPIKTIKKHVKFIYKPSQESLSAIKMKKKLYKKFKAKLKKVNGSNCSICSICDKCVSAHLAWDEYRKQRNLTNKITKTNKRENLVNDLKSKSAKNDLKGVWKSIKLAANLPTKTITQPTVDEQVINAENMNKHFCEVGPRLNATVPIYKDISFNDFLPAKNNDCTLDSFNEVSSEMIKSYVTSLSNKATTDQLPLRVIKAILPTIVHCLTHIVNLSLSTGQFPDSCKLAVVSPIFKGGDANDPNDYRPISILPLISKCIENSVNEQLTDFFESNKILSIHQYGFRKNHSTTYLTLDMFDKIFDSKSKGNTPAIIFLDIKKAFDTVDHKVLIEKLKFYGADGTVILWIKNYLLDRKQATKFLGEKSIFLCIKFGVPQGSLLGPLLFSIYINDLVNACNLSHPYLFADDGALLFENICRKTYLSIRIEMMTILKWLNVNKLSLNVDKTKILIFDNANFSVKIKLSNNYAIKECKSFKYLGLMIDNNLKFDIHVDYIKKKIQKRIGAMYRGCSLLPVKYRKMFANSLILPHFDYLDTIYGRAPKTKLHELDILYKKVAKIALGVEKTQSSIIVYKDMKWLPLYLRRQVHLSSYMFKILNGQSPSNFINKFKFISGGSRDGANCNLYTPKSKNLKKFYYLGAKAWNCLPSDLRNLTDPKVFSKIFKNCLLDSVVSDPNYIVNNAYDYIYKVKILN